jgi:hypothetical protein
MLNMSPLRLSSAEPIPVCGCSCSRSEACTDDYFARTHTVRLDAGSKATLTPKEVEEGFPKTQYVVTILPVSKPYDRKLLYVGKEGLILQTFC